MNELIKQLAAQIAGGDRVIAATSGGSDSTALLHLLVSLRRERGDFELRAAHFNHRLRPEADAEQALVAEMCRDWGVELITGGGDAAGFAKSGGISLHAAARELRYRFLAESAQAWGKLDGRRLIITTAHHRDDQVETVLMRLFSGAGVEGLAGIRQVEEIEGFPGLILLRPLLKSSREELLQHCRRNGLEFATDHSNFDPKFPRSRIRVEVLPHIREVLGESADEAVARFAELAAGTAELVESSIKQALKDCQINDGGGEYALDCSRYSSYLTVLQTGMLQRLHKRLAGSGSRVTLERLERAADRFASGRTGIIELGGAVRSRLWKGVIYVWREFPPLLPTTLVAGAEIEVKGWGRLGAEFTLPADCPIPPPKGVQYCAVDSVGPGPYLIRGAIPGDELVPLGTTSRQSVVEILRENNIPPQRRGWPLIEAGGKIIAVPPFRIADHAQITPHTRRVVAFKFIQIL